MVKRQNNGENANPRLDGNIRDHATLQQLIILSNMESFNAELIKRGLNREDRLVELNRMAREQMQSLIDSSGIKWLTDISKEK